MAWLIPVIKNGINPYKINTIIQSSVKIGIDEGENVLARKNTE
ncbi:MAG: hypothetical protein ACJ72U_04480 [Nitrososphaeraceae archaeon]